MNINSIGIRYATDNVRLFYFGKEILPEHLDQTIIQ